MMDIESRMNEIFERIKGKDIAPLAVFQGMRGIVQELVKDRDQYKNWLAEKNTERDEIVDQLADATADLSAYKDALKFINSDSNHCKYDTVSPIYRLPVPADKPDLVQAIFDASDRKAVDTFKHCPQCDHKCDQPAVAVPDVDRLEEIITIIDADRVLHPGALAQAIVNDLISAAPSHSQQSAQQTFELLMRDIIEQEPADPDSDRTVSVNYEWLYSRIREAFCPSSESEQGGAV